MLRVFELGERGSQAYVDEKWLVRPMKLRKDKISLLRFCKKTIDYSLQWRIYEHKR